jgi:hypothetical protein
MVGGLILLVLLAQPAAQVAPPTYEEAVAMARRGEYTTALAAFRQIVAMVPGDHDSRVWIGRLNGWLGDTGAAAAMFRSVILENANHVDARVALAAVLLNSGDTDAALEALADAERLAPADGDVLAGLGRTYFFRGELSAAVRFVERAVAVSPTPEHLALREQILRAFRHHLEVTGFTEHFTEDFPAAGNGNVALNLRASDRLRLLARGQVQNKFEAREWRAGGGFEWRANGATWLAASLLAGPDNTVLPRTDAGASVSYARGRIEWIGATRRITFATADVWVASPGVYISLSDRVVANGRYFYASTSFSSGPRDGGHSGAAGLSVLTGRRVWWSGGYARGTENFETLSPDRIGEFLAHTVSGGIRLDLPNLASFAAAYDRQWRNRGTGMGRLTLVLLHRF